jgi:hypothetical protein
MSTRRNIGGWVKEWDGYWASVDGRWSIQKCKGGFSGSHDRIVYTLMIGGFLEDGADIPIDYFSLAQAKEAARQRIRTIGQVRKYYEQLVAKDNSRQATLDEFNGAIAKFHEGPARRLIYK